MAKAPCDDCGTAVEVPDDWPVDWAYCDACKQANAVEANRFYPETMRGHVHTWGPIEHAPMTGNPHRKCACGFVSLDLDDDTDESED